MRDGTIERAFTSVKCLLIITCALFAFGCGTTKWSDTSRTGTEQLLISNAIDRVVTKIDFMPMRNKKCFLSTTAISQTTDRDYLATTIRQYLAASGAILATSEADADYVIEVRAGAVGTDRDDLLIGIPATTLPTFPSNPYSATTIPELPFIKRTKQRGVAKIALFAYNRETGELVWASGNNVGESNAQNLWFAGTGPLTRGTIYSKMTFAGNTLPVWKASGTDSMTENSQIFPETSQPSTVPIPAPVNPFVPSGSVPLAPPQ